MAKRECCGNQIRFIAYAEKNHILIPLNTQLSAQQLFTITRSICLLFCIQINNH